MAKDSHFLQQRHKLPQSRLFNLKVEVLEDVQLCLQDFLSHVRLYCAAVLRQELHEVFGRDYINVVLLEFRSNQHACKINLSIVLHGQCLTRRRDRTEKPITQFNSQNLSFEALFEAFAQGSDRLESNLALAKDCSWDVAFGLRLFL